MTKVATREVFGETLVELGRKDPNIVVLGGDLNVSTFAHLFRDEFPARFFDLGPAEQNMMSMAAGLASCGKTAFASTFAVFGTARPYDQIRMGIAQPGANVKIVCTHAGITTGEDGISAQSIEDIAIMCALPGFRVIVPADGPETAEAIRVAAMNYGPFYIRLSRSATPVVHGDSYKFHLGKSDTLQNGKDVTIIACGIMVSAALEAAGELAKSNIDCRVINMSTLKPLDKDAVINAAKETKAIVTAEEHYVHGGLGSIVAQVLGESVSAPLEIVAQRGYAESGNPQQLLDKYGLMPADIVEAAKRALSRKNLF